MRKRIVKATAMLSALMLCTTALSFDVFADDAPTFSSSETQALNALLAEFGYDSLADLLGDTRTLPDANHIKDLNGDNKASAMDAQFILNFVCGKRCMQMTTATWMQQVIIF